MTRRRLPALALRAVFALSALATFVLVGLVVTADDPRHAVGYLMALAVTGPASFLASVAINYRRVHDTDHENGSHR